MIQNITRNGEITLNTQTGIYTVWDESYSERICTTPCQEIAIAALGIYSKYLEARPSDSWTEAQLDWVNDQIAAALHNN